MPSQLPFYHVSPSSPVCPILCLSFSRINSHTFLTPSQDRHNHRFCSTVISACVLAGEDPRHCCCLLLPPKPIWRCGRPGDETPGTPLSCFYCASSSRHDIKRVAIPVYFKRYLWVALGKGLDVLAGKRVSGSPSRNESWTIAGFIYPRWGTRRVTEAEISRLWTIRGRGWAGRGLRVLHDLKFVGSLSPFQSRWEP